MNHDLECPYCGTGIEVSPDFRLVEDELFEDECPKCEKNFIFHVTYTINYYPEKADCLNGADHTWKKQLSNPCYPDRKVCTVCGKVDQGNWQEWVL